MYALSSLYLPFIYLVAFLAQEIIFVAQENVHCCARINKMLGNKLIIHKQHSKQAKKPLISDRFTQVPCRIN